MFCVFKQKTVYEMRISDWSSDVCSSDLPGQALEVAGLAKHDLAAGPLQGQARRDAGARRAAVDLPSREDAGVACRRRGVGIAAVGEDGAVEKREVGIGGIRERDLGARDRKRVGSGKRRSVRVDLGGRRTHKKKK